MIDKESMVNDNTNQTEPSKMSAITKIIVALFLVALVIVLVITLIIIPNQKLNAAMQLLEQGNYETAYAQLEQLGKTEIINKSKYDRALVYLNTGDIVSAYELFMSSNYKDSKNKAMEIFNYYSAKKANVGDIIFFGSYEQDNNQNNGKEQIMWRVVDKQDGKILAVSIEALDCKRYNEANIETTWENCSLRNWLNSDFLNNAFNVLEKNMIVASNNKSEDNALYGTASGNDTYDKVFILSNSEVKELLKTDKERSCKSTDYAKSQGALTSSSDYCFWWLRSPGEDSSKADYVLQNGWCSGSGIMVIDNSIAVRPAIWIDCN